MIGERVRCAEDIAEMKVKEGLPIIDIDVEKKVIERYVSEGTKFGLSEECMRLLARALIDESVRAENKVKDELEKK